MTTTAIPVRHYLWAGLDFMFDQDGVPVLLDANRSSHMMVEYLEMFGNDLPFELVAGKMNEAGGIPCLLWRVTDPVAGAIEDACWIGEQLSRHLGREPVVCNVEDNQSPRDELTTRDGRVVRPGSIFRWWYGLPWSYERSGALVVNPNSLWTVVRDKLSYPRSFAGARHFRAPASFAVDGAEQAAELLRAHPDVFARGFVVKPRVGWGGFGVQVGEAGDTIVPFSGPTMLCERVRPPSDDGRFWDVRVFVMAGRYLGGIRYSSRKAVTNFHQGGVASRLDDALSDRLRRPALEAVALIDALAHEIHTRPDPPATPLVNVVY
jgi:hypothetical protein